MSDLALEIKKRLFMGMSFVATARLAAVDCTVDIILLVVCSASGRQVTQDLQLMSALISDVSKSY